MKKDQAILVRVPKSIKRQLEREAEKEGRSLSQQVLQYIKRGLVEHAHD